MIYEVIQDTSRADFQARINEKLSKGWKLYGNLVATFNEYGSLNVYAQAITWEEPQVIS